MRLIATILQGARACWWMNLGGMYLIGAVLGAHNLHDLLARRLWPAFLFFVLLANFLLDGIDELCEHEPAALQDPVARRAPARRRRLFWCVLAAMLANCVLIGLARDWREQLLLGLFLVLALLDSLPPVRLQARPVLDLLAGGLYVLPAFVGYYQARGHAPAALVIVAALCWAGALRLLPAVQDVLYGHEADARTTAVALGVRVSLLACALLWSGFALIVVLRGDLMPLGVAAFIYPLAGFYLFEHFEMGDHVARWLPLLNAGLGGAVLVLALARLI